MYFDWILLFSPPYDYMYSLHSAGEHHDDYYMCISHVEVHCSFIENYHVGGVYKGLSAYSPCLKGRQELCVTNNTAKRGDIIQFIIAANDERYDKEADDDDLTGHQEENSQFCVSRKALWTDDEINSEMSAQISLRARFLLLNRYNLRYNLR